MVNLPTPKSQVFWMECLKAALTGGKPMVAAINCADEALYALDHRFNPKQDEKTSFRAGAALDVVMAYVPKEHLIHKFVVVDMYQERRVVGRIKEFYSSGVSDAGEALTTRVLVRYEVDGLGSDENDKIEVVFATANCRMVDFPLPTS